MDDRTLSRHTQLECAHAVHVRAGRAEPLGPRAAVPGCRCPKCVLYALHARGELDGGVVDLLMSNVLPALAQKVPAERPAVARRLKREWAEAAMVVLPSEELLVELAGRMPGARKAPRPVRDDREELPIEAARRAPIVDVCEQLGIELKRCGKSWRGPCPFHDSQSGTSFSVDSDKGLWHCFGGCGGGDVIDLLRRVDGVGFAAAVRRLVS